MIRKDIRDDYSSRNNFQSNRMKTRVQGFWIGDKQKVNSDFIFNHKDLKKKTKGYDKETGEIDKRGKPADNQKEIFMKKPEKEKTAEQLIKERKKKQEKKRESQAKKLYRQRLKTKWDRSW